MKTLQNNREVAIGDRVVITNNHKNKKGMTGIVLGITPQFVRIRTTSREVLKNWNHIKRIAISKKKSSDPGIRGLDGGNTTFSRRPCSGF